MGVKKQNGQSRCLLLLRCAAAVRSRKRESPSPPPPFLYCRPRKSLLLKRKITLRYINKHASGTPLGEGIAPEDEVFVVYMAKRIDAYYARSIDILDDNGLTVIEKLDRDMDLIREAAAACGPGRRARRILPLSGHHSHQRY